MPGYQFYLLSNLSQPFLQSSLVQCKAKPSSSLRPQLLTAFLCPRRAKMPPSGGRSLPQPGHVSKGSLSGLVGNTLDQTIHILLTIPGRLPTARELTWPHGSAPEAADVSSPTSLHALSFCSALSALLLGPWPRTPTPPLCMLLQCSRTFSHTFSDLVHYSACLLALREAHLTRSDLLL